MKRTYCLLLLLFVHSLLAEDDLQKGTIFDVETLPLHRSKQYSMGRYKTIVVFSAPRTGSTLVYNVMRFLFEDDSKILCHHFAFNPDRRVLKTHSFDALKKLEDDNILYLFIIRNPLDACISIFRKHPDRLNKLPTSAKDVVHRQYTHLAFFDELQQKGKSVAKLHFEGFVNNFEYLLDFVENHFSIDIAPEDRELMRKGYSKENIHACTRNLASFNEYLPFSGFHGEHVSVGNFVPPEELLFWIKTYLKEVEPLFKRHGYLLNCS